MSTSYVTKCVATQLEHKTLASGMQRYTGRQDATNKHLEDACGGVGPPPCGEGDVQIGPLYTEGAGAYHARKNNGAIVVNVVRTCLHAPAER